MRKMEEMTPEDYASIGLRSGLEIHQQLDTSKKLFCRCPVKPYSEDFDASILRHMRPTLSELGEYDGTALMEFKTKKEIIYQIHEDTVCTYEMDDTPPFELNRQALDIALEITMLLNCKLVSEVHIARKQYLDGSIPTGFQRTTILGVDGWIPYRDRRISIIQLGLEEDACREVSDIGHNRVYMTDRLGIPLIEMVTGPEMRTPREVAEVAQVLRYLARSSGKVRIGIGAARQDVNVSVEGGTRVEIKGVSRIPAIPLLVHNEALRQVALLEIKSELARRKITASSFKSTSHDITKILTGTRYRPAGEALDGGLVARAVVIKGYRGIFSRPTQPGITFAREVSDRVRVIACLDNLPNIAHNEMVGETFSTGEWEKISKISGAGDNDAVIVVWGKKEDVDTAASEISIRAREAIDGVVNETRQAMSDGTNGFERILPGPNRMYPDTDLPPIAITDEHMERIRSSLPERPWDRRDRYIQAGLGEEVAWKMAISPWREAFDEAAAETSFSPRELSHFFFSTMSHLRKKGKFGSLERPVLMALLEEADRRSFPLDAVAGAVEKTCGPAPPVPASVFSKIKLPSEKTVDGMAVKLLDRKDTAGMEKGKLKRFLMGRIRDRFDGIIGGRETAARIESIISSGGQS